MRAFFDMIKVAVIFVGLTVCFYLCIVWLNGMLNPAYPSDPPGGEFIHVQEQGAVAEMTARLLLFYYLGE